MRDFKYDHEGLETVMQSMVDGYNELDIVKVILEKIDFDLKDQRISILKTIIPKEKN